MCSPVAIVTQRARQVISYSSRVTTPPTQITIQGFAPELDPLMCAVPQLEQWLSFLISARQRHHPRIDRARRKARGAASIQQKRVLVPYNATSTNESRSEITIERDLTTRRPARKIRSSPGRQNRIKENKISRRGLRIPEPEVGNL